MLFARPARGGSCKRGTAAAARASGILHAACARAAAIGALRGWERRRINLAN